jgi:thymidylate synthase, flavin-dependent
MKFIDASYKIITPIDGVQTLKHLEYLTRICYNSQNKITEDSYKSFVSGLIKRKHFGALEHYLLSVEFKCDRAISHQIVRHRLFSFLQMSQRYCNYSKEGNELEFIYPKWLTEQTDNDWKHTIGSAEYDYFKMIETGHTPQQARKVLPNSTATTLVMTGNLRNWRYFLELRTQLDVDPDLLILTRPLLKELQEKIPIIFDDIIYKEK